MPSQREELNRLKAEEYDIEELSAKLTFDGKQFYARVPTEIAKILMIKKGDLLNFRVEIAEQPKPLKDSKLTITYVRKEHGKG